MYFKRIITLIYFGIGRLCEPFYFSYNELNNKYIVSKLWNFMQLSYKGEVKLF